MNKLTQIINNKNLEKKNCKINTVKIEVTDIYTYGDRLEYVTLMIILLVIIMAYLVMYVAPYYEAAQGYPE